MKIPADTIIITTIIITIDKTKKDLHFTIAGLLNLLYFLFENVAALVAGYAYAATAFRCFLNLLAGRALEVSIVFAVTVEPAAERSVNISSVPVQLQAHFAVVS